MYQKNPAEDIVERVLRKLKEENFIAGHLRNISNDRLDSEGIDFLIFLQDGFAIPLQVKTSSKRKNERKASRHHHKHPLIKFLIFVPIHNEAADKEVEGRLKAILKKHTPQ